MTELKPTNPSPRAVPWTPDMMNPQPALATHPQAQPKPQHYQAQQQQAAQIQSQPQYAHAQPQPAPQTYARQPQNTAASQMSHQIAPQAQPAQFAPQTRMAPTPTVQIQPNQAHPTAPPYSQAQFNQTPVNQPLAAAQFPQAGPPLLAHHMRVPTANLNTDIMPQAAPKSKSLFAKLLKRSPKPVEVQSDMPAPNSGSLFNKNFVLGAVTGLVIGAFVLPMALNIIGGDDPVQSQAQAAPVSIIETTPTRTDGNTFIDEAIAADAP